METMVFHGVLKQGNHGMQYNNHTQYMKKHGLPQFTMSCHGMLFCTYVVMNLTTNVTA